MEPMMARKIFISALLAFGLVLAACSSGTPDSGVASIAIDSANEPVGQDDVDASSDEEDLLAFAACLRDEGLDVDDPSVDADGNLQPPRARDLQNVDRDQARAAFEACSDLLAEVTFGLASQDLTEIQDNFLKFAVCMRENGYDMPDPDFSNFGQPGQGGGQGRGQLFGGDLDRNDPAFQSAFAACEDIFSDAFRIPGQGGGQG
jgi:hypothetical protein